MSDLIVYNAYSLLSISVNWAMPKLTWSIYRDVGGLGWLSSVQLTNIEKTTITSKQSLADGASNSRVNGLYYDSSTLGTNYNGTKIITDSCTTRFIIRY